MIIKKLAAFICAVVLVGCAASGVRVTEDQVKQFERGKTTYSEVIAKLGPPNHSMMLGNGMRIITYAYGEATARPATFIPIVGPLVGGADVRTTGATFTFDQRGILTNYSASSSQTGSGFGAAAHTQVSPVEDQPRKTQ